MIREIHYPADAGKKFQMLRYPAGEVQVRMIEPILHEDVVHVYATIKDGEIMGLAMLMDAIAWRYQTYLFLPYLPYSRADRRFVPGDCNGLGVFADVLRSVIRPNRVVTLDVHSTKANELMPELINVPPDPFIDATLQSLGDPDEKIQILLPDKGALSRYGIFNALHCEKKRDPKTGALSGFEVPKEEEFKGASAILLIDDICDGGGTFIGIAQKLEKYGIPLYLYVTHGIFSKGLLGLFEHYNRIFTTDSFQPEPHEGLTIFPALKVMKNYLKGEST